MTRILFWVKWVSYVNRVSSKGKTDWNLVFFGFALMLFLAFSSIGNKALASDISDQKIIELANADRKEKGIDELAENKKLSQAAEAKAEDMIFENYFSHTSPDGKTPWHWIENKKYDYNYAGENLAMDFESVEKMNQAWLASPTHRANIMNEKYKDIGVAVKAGSINGHKTLVVVQMFGSGDKNTSEESKNDQSRSKKQVQNQSDYVPALPIEKEGVGKIALASPFITSPQDGETVNQEKIIVSGRANPKSQVTILDGGVAVGNSVSDEKGWFSLEIKNISEGNHSFQAGVKNIPVGKEEIGISKKISFRIDREKPSLDYHLYSKGKKNGYLISLFSDKKNCYFELGEKKAAFSSNGVASFFVETGQSSIVVAVSDQAGNKTKKQIILANYFAGNGKSIFEDFAFSFLPQTAYDADSGRKALAANLGLVPHHFY